MGTNVNDKFLDIGSRGTLTTLAAPGKEIGASSVPLTSPTGWPSGKYVAFSIRRVQLTGADAGKEEQGTYTEWVGTLNGNSIDNIELQEGVDQDYPPGSQSQVMIHISVTWGKRLISGLRVAHTDDGKLKEAAVKEALGISGTVPPDWNQTGLIPTFVSNNGQKESVVSVPADVTNLIQAGTKVRIPRTGTTPTQSAAFVAASSQFASKTSPIGLTFTDNFTVEAWVYVDAYTVANQGIISRFDGTNGFILLLNAVGQIVLNIGGSTYQNSLTSVPVGRYVHVAASSAGGVVNIYLDGVLITSGKTGSANTIVQAGNLQVGSYNSANFFNGKISQTRVWSVVRTQQQIKDNMYQQIPGTSTGLVASFLLNNSWNDTSGSNNHLAPVNSAVNNFTSHPFKAVEFGVVTKVGAFASGSTPLTVFTGQSNSIPNETLGQLSYSTSRSPFGFPSRSTNWVVQSILSIQTGATIAVADTWKDMNERYSLEVPTGDWVLGYDISATAGKGGSGFGNANFGLTSSPGVRGSQSFESTLGGYFGNQFGPVSLSKYSDVTCPVKTPYSIVGSASVVMDIYVSGNVAQSVISAKCAYI